MAKPQIPSKLIAYRERGREICTKNTNQENLSVASLVHLPCISLSPYNHNKHTLVFFVYLQVPYYYDTYLAKLFDNARVSIVSELEGEVLERGVSDDTFSHMQRGERL